MPSRFFHHQAQKVRSISLSKRSWSRRHRSRLDFKSQEPEPTEKKDRLRKRAVFQQILSTHLFTVFNFAQLNKTDMVLNNSRRSGFLALSAGQFVILFPFIKKSFRKVFKKIYFPNFSSVTFQKCSFFLWYNSCLVVFRFPRDDSLILAMLEDPGCCWVG